MISVGVNYRRASRAKAKLGLASVPCPRLSSIPRCWFAKCVTHFAAQSLRDVEIEMVVRTYKICANIVFDPAAKLRCR